MLLNYQPPALIRVQGHLTTDARGLHQRLLWHLAVLFEHEYRKLAISGFSDNLCCLTINAIRQYKRECPPFFPP